MMIKTLVLSAGGYGSRLQTHYIYESLRQLEVYVRDTNESALSAPGMYLMACAPIANVRNIEWGLIVPSYNLGELKFLFDMTATPDISKSALRHHIPFPYHIPYGNYWNDNQLDGPFVIRKPLYMSGGKGIELVKNQTTTPREYSEYVFQEYVPGFELIIDGIVTENKTIYSYRLSLDRINGFDTMVTFSDYIDAAGQVRDIIENLNVEFMGPFNIQCRMHKGRIWKAMEIDFRLSGNSIINSAYDDLIMAYIHDLGGIPMWGANIKRDLVHIEGTYNTKATQIYSKLGIIAPHNWEP